MIAAIGPSPLWYLTRGTGLVALLLLTLTVVLGIVTNTRWSSPLWPRFANAEFHRSVSLLVVAVLTVHIITAELDTYAPVGLPAVIIPFASPYRPIWLGLGTLAFDLLLALIVSSLLRPRLGHRIWRTVHWAAYLSWPAALVHGLGTGSDARSSWVQVLTLACVVAVALALVGRVAQGWRAAPGRSFGVLGVMAAVLVLVGGWAGSGPFRSGWARRAGTPTALVATGRAAVATPTGPASSSGSPSSSGSSGSSGSATSSASGPLRVPFNATLVGTLKQVVGASGIATVHITTKVSGEVSGTLKVTLQGQSSGGGVTLSSSAVVLTLRGSSVRYTGTVAALNGDQLVASVVAGGQTIDLGLNLTINPTVGRVQGTVSGTLGSGAAS